MLVGILVTLAIPVVFGSLLWFTDWAESTLVASAPLTVTSPDQASGANPAAT
jgi:hypothetical protein